MDIEEAIRQSRTFLGIEIGSTRIKAVLIDDAFHTIASSSFEWENQLENGIWTYSLDLVWVGIQSVYSDLVTFIDEKYGIKLTSIGSIGISGMMHGLLAFDKEGNLLVPFRTWRNSITATASETLSKAFEFNIPQRWSISHLYQSILLEEEYVSKVDFFTTIAGYIHWKLTGEKVLGICDASGMFPIDVVEKNYNSNMITIFNKMISKKNLPWNLEKILPKILLAGDLAGKLTESGARLLDPAGVLQSGIEMCPPEGDAGTGMVATNSVATYTGNISAGTSAFVMIVLEKELTSMYPEVDIVTTPSGNLVGMIHENNCSTEINAWIKIFKEFAELNNMEIDNDDLYKVLYTSALAGDSDCGGMLAYGYHSGENITHIDEGRPIFIRSPKDKFTLSNFMKLHLFSAFSTIKLGLDILQNEEQIKIDKIVAHGGVFKTPEVGQRILSTVINSPVTVMKNAENGGAWGMAILANYMVNKKTLETLEQYLETKVFANNIGITIYPEVSNINGFAKYIKRYKEGLPIEIAAINYLK